MGIEGIGTFTHDKTGVWYSPEVAVPLLDGMECRFVIEDLDDHPDRADAYRQAILNFQKAPYAIWDHAAIYVYQHFYRVKEEFGYEDDFPLVMNALEIWEFVGFPDEIYVSRRDKDGKVHLSLDCECEWEPEHGVNIIFCEGNTVTRVCSFDGHLNNADAYNDPALENVIYY